MSLTLLGIGTATPPRSMAQSQAAQWARMFCGSIERLPLLYERTRIKKRGSVLLEEPPLDTQAYQSFFQPQRDSSANGPSTAQRMLRYEQEAFALGLAACRKALKKSEVAPSRIAQLVSVSCTGFAAPGWDVALIKHLKLSPSTGRTHIGFMGCHGAMNGLRVAGALGQSDPKKAVLLCAVELCSLHFQYGPERDKILANALFADGAAAAVGAWEVPGWKVQAQGSCLFPNSEQAMGWRIGDHGFEMSLSQEVPRLIGQFLPGWIGGWLSSLGLKIGQIGSWAVHPGGPKILSAVADSLKLQPQALAVSEQIFSGHGNMSSPTILFILERLFRKKPKSPCVALAFGPGLTVEAALLV